MNRNKRAPMVFMLVAGVAGCKPGYVEPDQTDPTEDGYGDTGGGTGDTGSTNPNVCFAANADAEAVRWQCEGFAEAALHFTVTKMPRFPTLSRTTGASTFRPSSTTGASTGTSCSGQ